MLEKIRSCASSNSWAKPQTLERDQHWGLMPSFHLTHWQASTQAGPHFQPSWRKILFFTSPLHTPCLFIFVCWSGFSFSRSTFSQYLLWCRCPWSLATNTMRKWEAVLPCPRASECPEAHEAPGGIRAARTDTRCSLVLVHKMGNPCSSGILGAGESCSCSRSDGTFYFWIFAVREGWRQLWKLSLLTADNSGSRSLFREADIFKYIYKRIRTHVLIKSSVEFAQPESKSPAYLVRGLQC